MSETTTEQVEPCVRVQPEVSQPEAFEVDMYVMGQYVGKRKVGRDSICGAFLAGDFSEAKRRGEDLQADMDRLTGRGEHPAG